MGLLLCRQNLISTLSSIGLLFDIIAELWTGTQNKLASLSLAGFPSTTPWRFSLHYFHGPHFVPSLTLFLDLAVHDTGLDKGDKIFIDGEGSERGLCRCGCW